MNKIKKINVNQEKEITNELIEQNFYIAKIDGSLITSKVEYMLAIDKAFEFPKGMFKNIDNFDSYMDWMKDLSWLGEQEGYAVFIHKFSKMMLTEPTNKEILLECFDDMICFWEKRRVHTVVGGKTKKFKVFLVEEN